MTLEEFRQSLNDDSPPPGLSIALQALWLDGKGDWSAAHERLQDGTDHDAAWVHAYLHRKEGDAGNAAYWYRTAGEPVARVSLEEEWTTQVRTLLAAR